MISISSQTFCAQSQHVSSKNELDRARGIPKKNFKIRIFKNWNFIFCPRANGRSPDEFHKNRKMGRPKVTHWCLMRRRKMAPFGLTDSRLPWVKIVPPDLKIAIDCTVGTSKNLKLEFWWLVYDRTRFLPYRTFEILPYPYRTFAVRRTVHFLKKWKIHNSWK